MLLCCLCHIHAGRQSKGPIYTLGSLYPGTNGQEEESPDPLKKRAVGRKEIRGTWVIPVDTSVICLSFGTVNAEWATLN